MSGVCPCLLFDLLIDNLKVHLLMILNCADAVTLHRDLTKLENWATTWKMRFNVNKCRLSTLVEIK